MPLGTMTNDSIREHCLSLEHATEVVQWGDHLLFKVGGKMFAMIDLDGHRCSMRCSPERYAELVEMEDIVPSSHNMWKYHWVTLEALDALPDRELRDALTAAYQLVRAKLPARVRAALDGGASPGRARPKRRGRAGDAKRCRPGR